MTGTIELSEYVIDAIANAVVKKMQEPKWIPVSERSPEDKQSVLVWCPQYKNIYCAYFEKEQWWIFGAFVQIVPNEVIAWMPLPEPMKAEREETVTEFADRCRECGREKVLKKICAEIMKLQTYKMFEGENTLYVELDDVLQIIDKYKAGRS